MYLIIWEAGKTPAEIYGAKYMTPLLIKAADEGACQILNLGYNFIPKHYISDGNWQDVPDVQELIAVVSDLRKD